MAEPPVVGFDLTVAEPSVSVGGTVRVELTNGSDAERITGNRYKYDVQHRGDDGWRSIYRYAEHPIWMDDAVQHPPGDGFTWNLELTQSGLTHSIERGSGRLVVCDPVRPGDYRFVYWGISPAREDETNGDTALAAEFTVIDE